MNQNEKIKEDRRQTATLFDSVCYVCGKPIGKAFHFHHVRYRKGEKTYKDFDASKSRKNWFAYTNYILPMINQHPTEFALLCQKHHKFVEMLIKLKEDKFEKLIDLAKRSRK